MPNKYICLSVNVVWMIILVLSIIGYIAQI